MKRYLLAFNAQLQRVEKLFDREGSFFKGVIIPPAMAETRDIINKSFKRIEAYLSGQSGNGIWI